MNGATSGRVPMARARLQAVDGAGRHGRCRRRRRRAGGRRPARPEGDRRGAGSTARGDRTAARRRGLRDRARRRRRGAVPRRAAGRAGGGRLPRGDRVRVSLVACGTSHSRRGSPWRSRHWPDGYHAGRSAARRDLATWVAAFNEAFTGHPTPLSLDATSYAQWIEDADIRDEDTILVEDETAGSRRSPRPSRSTGRTGRSGESGDLGAGRPARAPGPGAGADGAPAGHRAAAGHRRVDRDPQRERPQPARGLAVRGRGLRAGSTRDRWSRPVEARRHDDEA